MTRRPVTGFAVVVTLSVAVSAFAQPPHPTREATVRIQAVSNDTKLLVGPRGVGVCNRAQAADDCLNTVTFATYGSGTGGPEGDRWVMIEHAKSKSPSGADKCFSATEVALYEGHTQETLTVTASPACNTPTTWFYSVRFCEPRDANKPTDRSPDNCKTVLGPVDPGVIIDTGGN